MNSVDDDKNGFVDDVCGWDFVFDDPDPDHYVFDGMDAARIQPYWHSISALGIIGAGHGQRLPGAPGIQLTLPTLQNMDPARNVA